MRYKKQWLLTILTTLFYTTSAQTPLTEETCVETADGLEICIKQKAQNNPTQFTQKDAYQLAQSLPKLSPSQISALTILLNSQEGKNISQEAAKQLLTSLPKLPKPYLDAISLYIQSDETGTADPQEILTTIKEVLELPPQYNESLQSILKLMAEQNPSEQEIMNLASQLLKASNVPDEFGNTLTSYVTMVNEDDNPKAEDQFMKAGIGLLQFIIKASKDDETESSEVQP